MTKRITSLQILSRDEIATVLRDLHDRMYDRVKVRAQLAVFRLAACCGLRVSEICGLEMRDVRLGQQKPNIRIRPACAKRKQGREVPLWWDAGTLDDLSNWAQFRYFHMGARDSDPFVCSVSIGPSLGHAHSRQNARARFLAACGVLGPQRVSGLTIHHGRHTFVSHALKTRTLAEVQAAVGHRSLETTALYLHVAVDDNGEVGDLFQERRPVLE